MLSGHRYDSLWNRTNTAKRTNLTHNFSVVYGEAKCCSAGTEGSRVPSEPSNICFNFQVHLRAGSSVDYWLLVSFLPFDVGGYRLPPIFRVALTWLISKFLSDSMPELFFPKEASDPPVLFCGHIFLHYGYTPFIVSTHCYCLLTNTFFENSCISWASLEFSHSWSNLEFLIFLPPASTSPVLWLFW